MFGEKITVTKKMKWLLGLWLCVLVGCAKVEAQPTLQDRIDGLFAAYDEGERPGYAIGVIRDGELIHAMGYGLADISAGVPITPDTAFNLASLSKQFTAASVAIEIEAGRLDLDVPFSKYWTDLPNFMSEITIGHLVYMTSGLREYYTLQSPRGGWQSEDKFTVEDAISAVFDSGELIYEPGTQWTYSNINYQLLAELTARLNARPFAEHMDNIVFTPLGMQNSWVDAPLDTTRSGKTTSYVWADDEGWRIAPRLSPHYGGSGVFSSLNDLAKWDRALYQSGELGDGFGTRMLSTRKYAHDKDNDAFGLVHGTYQGLQTVWYEGGDYGVSTYMIRLLERNETVICLSNFGNARCADKARAVIDLLVAFEPI